MSGTRSRAARTPPPSRRSHRQRPGAGRRSVPAGSAPVPRSRTRRTSGVLPAAGPAARRCPGLARWRRGSYPAAGRGSGRDARWSTTTMAATEPRARPRSRRGRYGGACPLLRAQGRGRCQMRRRGPDGAVECPAPARPRAAYARPPCPCRFPGGSPSTGDTPVRRPRPSASAAVKHVPDGSLRRSVSPRSVLRPSVPRPLLPSPILPAQPSVTERRFTAMRLLHK